MNTLIGRSDLLIHEPSGTYPITLSDMPERHPTVSLGPQVAAEYLESLGYKKVTRVSRPSNDVVNELTPVKDAEGAWVQVWEARAFNEAELQEQLAAKKRVLAERIKALGVAAFEKGQPFETPNGIKYLQLRPEDRSNVIGLHLFAKELLDPNSVMFNTEHVHYVRTLDNTMAALSSQEMLALSWAALAGINTIYGSQWALEKDLEKAADEASLPALPANIELQLQ